MTKVIKIENGLFENNIEIHTNFEVTRQQLEYIEKLEGVVSAYNFFRYKLEISIGLCFDKEAVTYRIMSYLKNQNN